MSAENINGGDDSDALSSKSPNSFPKYLCPDDLLSAKKVAKSPAASDPPPGLAISDTLDNPR
jgi:hypothetical protein